MNSSRAHRRRRRTRVRPALRLSVALGALATIGFATPGSAACGRPGARVEAVSVDERLDITLADGKTVRLGGLDAPDWGRGAPELASSARDFVAHRVVGKETGLIPLAEAPDRWGRTVADLVLPDSGSGSPVSLAEAMLAAGFARVRPEFETRGCAASRLAVEDRARRARLGIWSDPDFAVIPSSDLPELRRRDGKFVVIEGVVDRVGFGRSRLYLELHPRGGPTIVITRKLEAALGREGVRASALIGRTIRARGALDGRFGPRIEVGEPAMIEIARRADAPGEAEPRP